ncbi:DUF3263 domain-containing protein [Glycomyces terrestris]|uniref:DUF3263 domain-containing protein n=1 Tax=Glycomyces terrestris TaxID=2493553 RepID=A0A426UST9_9ACTN|nr:DUF3263 domain-containing protein [Glycomyces terrestris]RRR96566.1 DUF3263 domain-containing protein [Glycomyces terrestris]
MPPGQRPAHSTARTRLEDEEGAAPQRPFRGPEAAPRQSGPPRTPRDPETKLSAMESRILEFEARWWRASGAKTQAIADELELTPERYYQHLARLIDHPEAAAEQPAVVRRLRAARDERRAAR